MLKKALAKKNKSSRAPPPRNDNGEWRKEIVQRKPFTSDNFDSVGNRRSTSIEKGIVEKALTTFIQNGSMSPARDRSSSIQSTDAEDFGEVRKFRVSCPGSKMPIRATPNIKGDVVRYIRSGTEIEVFNKIVSGFYQLTDKTGYVNKWLLDSNPASSPSPTSASASVSKISVNTSSVSTSSTFPPPSSNSPTKLYKKSLPITIARESKEPEIKSSEVSEIQAISSDVTKENINSENISVVQTQSVIEVGKAQTVDVDKKSVIIESKIEVEKRIDSDPVKVEELNESKLELEIETGKEKSQPKEEIEELKEVTKENIVVESELPVANVLSSSSKSAPSSSKKSYSSKVNLPNIVVLDASDAEIAKIEHEEKEDKNELVASDRDVLMDQNAVLKEQSDAEKEKEKIRRNSYVTPRHKKLLQGHVHSQVMKTMRLPRSRLNILVVGPSGCGKTLFLRNLLEGYVEEDVERVLRRRNGEISVKMSGKKGGESPATSEEESEEDDDYLLDWPVAGEGEKEVVKEVAVVHAVSDGGNKIDIHLSESVGFGDIFSASHPPSSSPLSSISSLNSSLSSSVSVVKNHLLALHASRLSSDLQTMTREEALLADERIHAVFYLIPATTAISNSGRSRAREVDEIFFREISQLAPVVPVISKGDALTEREKERVKDSLVGMFSQIEKQSGKCFHSFVCNSRKEDDKDNKEIDSPRSDVSGLTGTESPRPFHQEIIISREDIFCCISDLGRLASGEGEKCNGRKTLGGVTQRRNSDLQNLRTIIFDNEENEIKRFVDSTQLKTIELNKKKKQKQREDDEDSRASAALQAQIRLKQEELSVKSDAKSETSRMRRSYSLSGFVNNNNEKSSPNSNPSSVFGKNFFSRGSGGRHSSSPSSSRPPSASSLPLSQPLSASLPPLAPPRAETPTEREERQKQLFAMALVNGHSRVAEATLSQNNSNINSNISPDKTPGGSPSSGRDKRSYSLSGPPPNSIGAVNAARSASRGRERAGSNRDEGLVSNRDKRSFSISSNGSNKSSSNRDIKETKMVKETKLVKENLIKDTKITKESSFKEAKESAPISVSPINISSVNKDKEKDTNPDSASTIRKSGIRTSGIFSLRRQSDAIPLSDSNNSKESSLPAPFAKAFSFNRGRANTFQAPSSSYINQKDKDDSSETASSATGLRASRGDTHSVSSQPTSGDKSNCAIM